jgi:hypothetical protein
MSVQRYRYKPNAGIMVLATATGAGFAYLSAYAARTNDRTLVIDRLITLSPSEASILFWVIAALFALATVLGAHGILVGLFTRREIILTDTDLKIPIGVVARRSFKEVKFANITRLTSKSYRGRYSLYVYHAPGRVLAITEDFMPDAAAFDEFCSELAHRVRRFREVQLYGSTAGGQRKETG